MGLGIDKTLSAHTRGCPEAGDRTLGAIFDGGILAAFARHTRTRFASTLGRTGVIAAADARFSLAFVIDGAWVPIITGCTVGPASAVGRQRRARIHLAAVDWRRVDIGSLMTWIGI